MFERVVWGITVNCVQEQDMSYLLVPSTRSYVVLVSHNASMLPAYIYFCILCRV